MVDIFTFQKPKVSNIIYYYCISFTTGVPVDICHRAKSSGIDHIK